MDKNTLWGIVLMGLVIMTFSWLSRPNPEEVQAREAERAQLEQATAQRDAATQAETYDDYPFEGLDTTVTLTNELISLQFSSKGGIVTSAKLADYYSYATGNNDSIPVELMSGLDSRYRFIFTSASQRFDTSKLYFTPKVVNDSVVEMTTDLALLTVPAVLPTNESNPGDTAIVELPKPLPANFTLRYTLRPNSYILTLEVIQDGIDRIIPQSIASAQLQWDYVMLRNELGRTFEENKSSLSYKYLGDSPDELSSVKKDDETLRQRVKWIAFKNQFFSVVSIPRASFVGAEVSSVPMKESADHLKSMSYDATIDYSSASSSPFAMDIFIGPNLYPLLSSLDNTLDTPEKLQLTRLIPLGWPIIRWINTLIIIPTFTWLGTFITNYGIIILLLTIFIKIIIYPFTYKSFLSQAKMRVLAPEIKEINEKYPGQQNAMTRNQKTMALYSRAGASPMAGCIPMLFQMPVLFAMFWFFPSCIELRGKAFLWAQNLAAPDYIATLPFTIPFYGNRVSLFCLLMTVCNIVYTRINMASQPSGNTMPGMKWMMYLMPLMFLFFFNDYASGLSYYYLLSLLITIIMTYIFRAVINEEKLRKKMMERAAKPRKKSKFMERLEEAQRRQEAMLREQQKRNRR